MLTHDTTPKHVPVSNPILMSFCGEWTHQSCWQTPHPHLSLSLYNPWIVIETLQLRFINSSYLSIFTIYFMPLLCRWAILRKLNNSTISNLPKKLNPKKTQPLVKHCGSDSHLGKLSMFFFG